MDRRSIPADLINKQACIDTCEIRRLSAHINACRLFVARTIRASNLYVSHFTNPFWLRRLLVSSNPYTGPLFAHLAWIFMLPRLITNCISLVEELLKKPKDRNIMAQIKQLWPELANDLAWICLSALQAFLLVGNPLNIYITTGFLIFDVIIASLRAIIDGRGKDAYELLRLCVPIITTTLIFIAFTLTLPALSLSPLVVVLAAASLVLISVFNLVFPYILAKLKPETINRSTFFAEKQPTAADARNAIECYPCAHLPA